MASVGFRSSRMDLNWGACREFLQGPGAFISPRVVLANEFIHMLSSPNLLSGTLMASHSIAVV
jgi:hypothetical protein